MLKVEKIEKPRELYPQSQGILPSVLCVMLFSWACWQQMQSGDAFGPMKLGYVFVVSYLYSDYWLWMLHCFLDREENLDSVIGFIKETATDFQGHHQLPANLLSDNHLGSIDSIVIGTAGMGLLLGPWTSATSKLIVLGVTCWGALGCLNHFYSHAMTHGYAIPAFYSTGQRLGLLPTAKHHKMHHTAPFEENWNFLVGLHKIYEAIYFACGSSYIGLFAMFYSLNPVFIQAPAMLLGLLA